jgi:hypothetical protein
MNFVQIANTALDLVAQQQIMSLDDPTNAARKAKLHIYDAIREVLAAGLWKSARKAAVLAELSPAPTFGWAHRYQLPGDYISFVTLNDVDPRDVMPPLMEVRGRELQTDETEANLVYIADLTAAGNDINAASPLLSELFALKLATKLAWVMQQSRTLRDSLLIEYHGTSGGGGKLGKALARDAREAKRPIVNQLFQSSWLRDRLGSTNG